MMKINVDGVVAKTQNRGALSAVCREDKRQFWGVTSVSIEGVTDPEVLEVMACAETLSLAKDVQLNKFHISSDCLSIIKEIGPHCMIIKEVASHLEDPCFMMLYTSMNGGTKQTVLVMRTLLLPTRPSYSFSRFW
jgi:hypothetical protein